MMRHSVNWDVFTVHNSRTKIDILTERRDFLAAELARIDGELNNFAPFGRPCSGCGEMLETEKDFAAHFIVTDERYLNLGNCPESPRR